ncbi:MAG: ribonuclease R family protein [Cyanobacteriota bacterium]|nr:ribonuclease R family protein [Cyanobacteriota bacterium]
MEFSIATLLSNFTDDKLVAPKVLEKKLECEDERGLTKLQIILEALEKIGILIKDRGRYRREFEEDIVEAKLRCSSKGFCFAIQDEEGAEDIYVRESHLSTAWNGDRVLVRVIKEGSRRRSPEGEVKLILERANPSVLARIKDSDEGYRAVPLDDRLLFEIELAANGTNLQEAIDYLVHVEVMRYPLGSSLPVGRVAQILGSDAEAADDIDIVCCKHDLPRAFPPKALKADAEISGKLKRADTQNRQNLRKTVTLGFIDETSNNDIVDRAFSVKKLKKSGEWEISVHVSDVSHHIPVDSPLDRETSRRGNSIFVGDMILPLLPDNMKAACNLTPEVDRLAMTIALTINDQGETLGFEIQPSVIQVDRQLTYSEVQAVLDRDVEAGEVDLPKEVLESIDRLFKLTGAIREQRLQRGAFELNLPETHNHFDNEDVLGVMVLSPMLPARAMACELLVLVNQCVGEHLKALDVPGIFCVHPAPDLSDVQDMMKLASNMGVELWLEDEEAIDSTDFKQFTEQFVESDDEKILTYLLEATLKSTYYSTKPGFHFGLALESGYTHITSPMQRYPDLQVLRVLHAVFDRGRDRRSTRSKDRVDLHHSSCHGNINWNVLPPEIHHELETQLNAMVVSQTEREKLAIEAEEDLSGLQKAGAMKERTGEVFQGLITGVQSYGFFVELESGEKGAAPSRLEGLVHVSSLKDDWYEYRSRQQTLVGRKNRKQYRLGDRVDVQVKSVDYYRQQIDLAPIGGGSEATNGDYFDSDDD